MTKRSARRRWIRTVIASNFVYPYIRPLRNTFAKTLTKSTMRQKGGHIATIEQRPGASASTRPTISGKYEPPLIPTSTPLRRSYVYFSAWHESSLPPSSPLMGKKEKKDIARRTSGLLLSSISRRHGETSDVQFSCSRHAPIKDNVDLTPSTPYWRHWRTSIIYVSYLNYFLE